MFTGGGEKWESDVILSDSKSTQSACVGGNENCGSEFGFTVREKKKQTRNATRQPIQKQNRSKSLVPQVYQELLRKETQFPEKKKKYKRTKYKQQSGPAPCSERPNTRSWSESLAPWLVSQSFFARLTQNTLHCQAQPLCSTNDKHDHKDSISFACRP